MRECMCKIGSEESIMKKIGILTITHGQNYGNRLQNYAVQTVLERMGATVETIYNTTKIFNTRSLNYRIKLFIKRMTGFKLEQSDIRSYKFDKFIDRYIHWSKYEVNADKIPKGLADAYDVFVSGSDQVWNPNFGYNSYIDFITFADKKKRVAYAASFGISTIPKDLETQYAEWINGLNYISVREAAGADIVKHLTGREATVLIDPTMMLDEEDWVKLEKRPKEVSENQGYIFIYFLGDLTEDVDKYIDNIALETGYKKIYLYNHTDERQKAREDCSFSYDPSEFLWLIHHAQMVFTDSFHSCVFSILYKTPFRVFQRQEKEKMDMSSRLDNLLSIFEIQWCHADFNETAEQIMNFKIDTQEVLREERERAIAYLEKALQ